MNDDVVAVLQRAKEKAAKKWTQGAFEGATGVCLLGALEINPTQRIFSARPGLFESVMLLRSVTGARSMAELVDWNDDHRRTQVEILDAFDAAIRLAKDSA